MKKIGFLAVVASLMLSLTALAGERSTNKKAESQTPAADGKAKVRNKARADAAQSPEALTKQLASLKQEHQVTISELEEIKKLAVEEKATKTAGKLDQLIARHNQEYQKRIEPLQQRLKKLERQAKGGDKDKTNGDKGKGGDDKGGRPKDNPRKGKGKG